MAGPLARSRCARKVTANEQGHSATFLSLHVRIGSGSLADDRNVDFDHENSHRTT